MPLFIARLELNKLFLSPIAWVVMALFLLKTGVDLASLLEQLFGAQKYRGEVPDLTFSLLSGATTSLFYSVKQSLFVIIPLLTMGLISEERRSGTLHLLYSSPIKIHALVLGKYLAIFCYCIALIALLTVLITVLSTAVENIDYGLIFSGLTGLLLMSATYAAIGLCISSLTRHPVLAAVITIAVLALLDYIGGVAQGTPIISDLFYWLSISRHADTAIEGLLSSKDLLYFTIIILLFLYLTLASLVAQRQLKQERKITITKGFAAIFMVSVCGYLVSLPQLTLSKDMTATLRQSLNPQTEQLLSAVDGDLRFTAYENLFTSHLTRPAAQAEDRRTFEKMQRSVPALETQYRFFYRDPKSPWGALSHRTDLSASEKVDLIKQVYDLHEAIPPYDSVVADHPFLVDYPDGKVRVMESHGKKVPIRWQFSDMTNRFQPSEEEIAAVLKQLTVPAVSVGFVTGHHEAALDYRKPSDWGGVVTKPNYRHSLINNGFRVEQIQLPAAEIPDHVELLIVANPKSAFSNEALRTIEQYIDRGGNLLVAVEPDYAQTAAPLLALLSVQQSNSAVVSINSQQDPNQLQTRLTRHATEILNPRSSGELELNRASSLQLMADAGFNAIPALIGYEPETALMLLLERAHPSIQHRQQKVVVCGDAGLFDNNGVLAVERGAGVSPQALLIEDIFAWLSDDRYPVRIRPLVGKDNRLLLTNKSIQLLPRLFYIRFSCIADAVWWQ